VNPACREILVQSSNELEELPKCQLQAANQFNSLPRTIWNRDVIIHIKAVWMSIMDAGEQGLQ
jgi:hypothetical protein